MQELKLPEESLIYARLLNIGRAIGLVALIISFGIYIAGIIPPRIPLNELSAYWGLSAKDYLARSGIHTGWSWMRMLGYSDFMNFLPIAFLCGITIICYLSIIPIFFRKKDRIYAWIAILGVLVLVFAASGILQGGIH